jgi:hypothetical protein
VVSLYMLTMKINIFSHRGIILGPDEVDLTSRSTLAKYGYFPEMSGRRICAHSPDKKRIKLPSDDHYTSYLLDLVIPLQCFVSQRRRNFL